MSRESPDPGPGPISVSVSDPMSVDDVSDVNDEHQWASALTSLGDNTVSRNPSSDTNLVGETPTDGERVDVNVSVDHHDIRNHHPQAHNHFAVADPMAQHQQEQAVEEGLDNQHNLSHHHQLGEFLRLDGTNDKNVASSNDVTSTPVPGNDPRQIDSATLAAAGGLDHDNVDILLHHANEQLMLQNNQSMVLQHVTIQSHNPPPFRTSSGKVRKDFEYRLREVKNFKAKYGHCMIPHKFSENPSLGTWVDTQRRRYRKYMKAKRQGNVAGYDGANPTTITARGGNGSTVTKSRVGGASQIMSQDQVDRLLEIGFVFEPRMSREDTWQRRVAELRAFKTKHGHCNVREDDTSVPGLGKWVSYVRRSNRLAKQGKRAKKLSEEKLHQLKTMGFIFELKEEMAMRRFRDGLEFLKEFREKEGHLQVPNFYESNATMGLCVEDMRSEYRKICHQISTGGEGSSQLMSNDIVQELARMGFLAEENMNPIQPSSVVGHRHSVSSGIYEGVQNDVGVNAAAVTQVQHEHLGVMRHSVHQGEVGAGVSFHPNQLTPEPVPVHHGHTHLDEQIGGYPTLSFDNIQQNGNDDTVDL